MRRGSRGARRATVAALAALAIPVVAGCDTSPDAAAVIGGSRISVGTLQGQVDAALADPQIASALAPGSQFSQALGGSRAGFVRVTLSRLISDRLVSIVAAQHHVVVTSKEVADQTNAFVAQAGSLSSLREQAAEGVGVTAAQLPELIRLTVMQQQLGNALVANLPATPQQLRKEYRKDIDDYDQLDVSQIAVSSKSLAHKLLAKARRAPATFPALARQYSEDSTTSASGGHVGLVGRSEVVSLLGSAAKAKVGSIQLAHANGEYSVIRILSRQVTPFSQVTAKLKASLFASQAQTLLVSALTNEARTLGIHVSPRYGHWDSKTQSVVATKSDISSGS